METHKKLRKLISKTVRECLNERLLNEYVTNDIVYLKNYFSTPKSQKIKYLPHEYYYYFDDFLDETDTYFEMPKETRKSDYLDEPDEEVDMFDDNNDLELIIWLENNDKETFKKFAEYLFDKISDNTLPIDPAEYPAWSYFDDSPQIIKNQWLIHFTNDANSIAENGFEYGVDDMTKLGLTTSLGEFDKKYGGYNFAYTLNDFQKYGRSSYGNWSKSGYKYGNEAVIFNASGIKVWHYGDEEPQVIFYGNTAKNIIPITSGYGFKFAVYGKNDKILYENDDLPEIVKWIVKNYQQYRKNFVY
jgi:hypothetical protein